MAVRVVAPDFGAVWPRLMPSGVTPPDAGRPPYLWVFPFEVPEWFPNNVARNSAPTGSNIELASLELQRLWAVSKNDRVKLRAKFVWGPLSMARVGAAGPPDRRACSNRWVFPFEISEWFPNNVARNSAPTGSNIELASLELQRLWAVSKNDRVKLRAKFVWGPLSMARVGAAGPLDRQPGPPDRQPGPTDRRALCAPRRGSMEDVFCLICRPWHRVSK